MITKTPDNNWWDGFHCGQRGFIPVAYVEVTELKPSPSPSPSPATLQPTEAIVCMPVPVPAPPTRRSSIPIPEAEPATKVSEAPREPVIPEEDSREPPTPEPVQEENLTSPVETSPVSTTATSLPQPQELNLDKDEGEVEAIATEGGEEKAREPSSAKSKGSVKSLTKQFQESEVTSPKILVEPFQSHRRQLSDHYKLPPPVDVPEPLGGAPRSASSGNKVSMLSTTFESKKAASSGPPPLKPRPASSAPSSDVFPLMGHTSTGVLAVSPLQRAVHQSQHVLQKPVVSSRKPVAATVVKATGKSGKAKLKKKDSLREKEKAKPVPTPKPGFVASPAEIQAEFQARAKRKHGEDVK